LSRARTTRVVHDTAALLLRRVPVGESDLVVTLLTETLGRVSAIARAARRSQRRFGGSLEALHTLRVRLEERTGSELMVLVEARIATVRSGLLGDLERMQIAGRALGWVRDAVPPHLREPSLWSATLALLDDLGNLQAAPSAPARLAAFGLELLGGCGWALDLDRCVACGGACPEGQAATIDPRRGGLVCRACGGARLRLPGPARTRLAPAARGASRRVADDDAAVALALVEAALAAHVGIE